MRLTEMHYWLYSTISRCLEQEDADVMEKDITASGDNKFTAKPLLFCIAGVELAPSPHFRLQMLLLVGVHYLGRMQKGLGGLEAHAFDGTSSEGPPDLALQTHMLTIEYQKGCMAKIRLVLYKLKDAFGMHFIL